MKESMLSTELGRFRAISLLEGISYVVLLAIAMPLKYLAGQPEAVSWAGRIHGGLFILLVLALASVSSADKWTRRQATIAMVAALVPLGAFWLEARLRRNQAP